jgi:Ni/Fe-hydrogenase subunit HybB-like protein
MGILIPGQVASQMHGLQQAFQDPRLVYAYSPTLMEYLVGCFMVALGMATLWIGIKVSKQIPEAAMQSRGEA